MIRVKKIELSSLCNENHLQFASDFMGILKGNDPVKLKIGSLFIKLCEIYELEKEILNPEYKEMLELDNKRFSLYLGILSYNTAFLHCEFDTECRKAAVNIQKVIDQYGYWEGQSYSEEASSINNLLCELNQECSSELQTIGLEKWIDQLMITNHEFVVIMDEYRNRMVTPQYSARGIRKEFDSLFNHVMDTISVFTSQYGEENYSAVNDQLSSLTDKNRSYGLIG